jgi:hypothetical protein
MRESITTVREAISAWERAGVQTDEWPVCTACGGYGERGPQEPVCRVCNKSGRTFPGRLWRLRKTLKLFFTQN